MQSKWRGWRPNAEGKQSRIIGISTNPQPSKPSRPISDGGSDGFDASPSATFPIIRSPRPSTSHFWGAHGDEFGWRLNCAWDLICRDYLAGMIAWLETNEPLLYDRITRNLPDKISSAWNAVPFSEFDLLCHELEVEHGRATDLYRQYLRASEARRLQ